VKISFAQEIIEYSNDLEVQKIGKHIEYFNDTTNNISNSKITHLKSFKKSKTIHPLIGSENSTLWIRFSIQNKSESERLLLHFDEFVASKFSFYNYDENKLILLDSMSSSDYSGASSRNFYIELTPDKNSYSTYYIKIKSEWKNSSYGFKIGTEKSLNQFYGDKYIFDGIYIGIILLMILSNIILYATVRDLTYLYYGLYIFFFAIGLLGIVGYLFEYGFVNSTASYFMLNKFISLGIVISGCMLAITVLQTKVYSPVGHKLILYLMGLTSLFIIIMLVTGRIDLYVTLISALNALILTIFIIVSYVVLRKGYQLALFFFIGWLSYLVTTYAWAFHLLTGIDSTLFNHKPEYYLIVGHGIEVIFFSVGLAYRVYIMKKEKETFQGKAISLLQVNKEIITNQNIVLEETVKLRTVELEKSNSLLAKKNMEKTAMLKEIHHRVKNNLQVVNSLLKLQSRDIEDENVVAMFKEAQNRVLSMALLHEKMYRSDNLQHIDVQDHITLLVEDLLKTYVVGKDINSEINVKDIVIGIRTLVPLGLIINEIITNALKHAFKGREKGGIKVHLKQLKGTTYEMIIGDDGVGLKEKNESKGIGTKLIQIFTKQLNGSLELLEQPGSVFKLTFNKID